MSDFLHSLLDRLPVIAFVSDSTKATVTWCNTTFEDESGYSLSEMRELGFLFFQNILHPEDFPRAMHACSEFESEKIKSYFDYSRIKGKNKQEWKWFAGIATVSTAQCQGTNLDVVCILLPITFQYPSSKLVIKEIYKNAMQEFYFKEIQLITPREKTVVSLISKGDSLKMIADKLHIKEVTVEYHIIQLKKKLRVPNIASLIAKIKEIGL